jgi:hypothetical protein
MSSTAPTAGQAFLALITSDLATTGGAPLITFLESIQAAKGNLGLEAAALLQLEAAGPAAGISFLLEIQQQLVGLAITKLQGYLATKTAAPAA